MGFPVPTFNLPVNLWRVATPVGNPPDLQFNANLSFNREIEQIYVLGNGTMYLMPPSYLLCPKLTDIRGHNAIPFDGDCVEVPGGSGRFYAVFHVEDVAKGFSNEYRVALLEQIGGFVLTWTQQPSWVARSWPTPTP